MGMYEVASWTGRPDAYMCRGPDQYVIVFGDVEPLRDLRWCSCHCGLDEIGLRVESKSAHLGGEAAVSISARGDSADPANGGHLLNEGPSPLLNAHEPFVAQDRDRSADAGLVQPILTGEVGLAGQWVTWPVLAALDCLAQTVRDLPVTRLRRLQIHRPLLSVVRRCAGAREPIT